MNKKILLFLVCTSLLFGAVSCGNKNKDSSGSNSNNSSNSDSSSSVSDEASQNKKNSKDKNSKKPADSDAPDNTGEKEPVNADQNADSNNAGGNSGSNGGGSSQAATPETMFKTGVWAATDGKVSFSYYFIDSKNQCGRQENMLSHQGIEFTYSFEDGYVVFDQSSLHEIDKCTVTLISDTEGMIEWPNSRVETLTFVSSDINNFTYHSNFELEDAAQKFYTKDMTEEDSYKYMVRSENEKGGKVRIEIYTFEDNDTHVQMVYNVDQATGKGTDNSGEEVSFF